MTEINRVQNISITPSIFSGALHSSSLSEVRGSSSIRSLNCCCCITYPFRCIKKVISSLFSCLFSCCCCRSKEKKLDWTETQQIFTELYTLVCTSTDHMTNRKKEFDKLYPQLSQSAKERLNDHLAFAFAKTSQGKRDRSSQQSWVNENRKMVPFTEILGNIDHPLLKEGVRTFMDEIDQKAPPIKK